jgi:hypothetical protein
MKRARIGFIAVAVLAVSTLAFAQAKPDFSGTWTLDPEASQMGAPGGGGGGRQGAAGRGGGMMGGPMTVKHTGDTLVVERMQGENKVAMTYKLDGSQSKNTVAGRGGTQEQVSVAKWDGNKVVITRTQQMADQSVEITETWAMEGGNLTIARTGGGRGGATKQVYKKS